MKLEDAYKKAMTISELMDSLECYNSNMKVVITLEGIFQPLTKENIYKGSEKMLILDADNNFYKEDFEI